MSVHRVDVEALRQALDEKRLREGLSWRQVAQAAGLAPSTLTRMSKGARPDVDGFASLIKWLDAPAERFIRARQHEPEGVQIDAP